MPLPEGRGAKVCDALCQGAGGEGEMPIAWGRGVKKW